MKKYSVLGLVLLSGLVLTACGNEKESASNNSSTSSIESNYQDKAIVGSYQDYEDGAALNINSNHTGRYVFYDPQDENTDDNFKWKKLNDKEYQLDFDDSDITAPVILHKLSGGQFSLTSDDSNWKREIFSKENHSIDLDEFLAKRSSKSSSNTTTSDQQDNSNGSKSSSNTTTSDQQDNSNESKSNSSETGDSSKAAAIQKLKYAQPNCPIDEMEAIRIPAGGWLFKEPAGHMPRYEYYVYDDSFEVHIGDITPND